MSKAKLASRRVFAVIGMLIVLALVDMYVMKEKETDGAMITEQTEQKLELSAWLVDWEWKAGLADLQDIAGGLTRLQAFAAYFDDQDRLYFTKDSDEAFPKLFEAVKQNDLVDVDLTVVNDRWNRDGTAVQKDTALVTRLMASETSRNQHIADILDAVDKHSFRGVEIDYEKIGDQDWDNVCAFYTELYRQLDAQGKSLRIVLEARTPIERLKLPAGPTYVMMAYNLYGNHSGPGPKADRAFLTKLTDRMKQVPGEKVIALSAGGYDWAEGGKITSLTEKRAAELVSKKSASPKRDEQSGALYFDYLDERGVKHTVWYADAETLSQWIDVSRKAGYHKIAIWRLGDLGQATLEKLNR